MLRPTIVSWLRCNGRLRNAPLPRIVDASRLLEDDLVCENLSACMGRIVGFYSDFSERSEQGERKR